MEELWLPIENYPGYEISNYGKARSVDRLTIGPRGKQWLRLGVLLKQSIGTSGYSIIAPSKCGRNHTLMIHRLVAQAFLPNPKNKPEVNHKDGNKQNNHVDNLEWATGSENMRHSTDTELRVYKPVLNLETGIYYQTMTAAARAHNIPIPTLHSHMKAGRTPIVAI